MSSDVTLYIWMMSELLVLFVFNCEEVGAAEWGERKGAREGAGCILAILFMNCAIMTVVLNFCVASFLSDKC